LKTCSIGIHKEGISPSDSAINTDLHIQRDDAVDFRSEFAAIFEVDMSHFPFEEYFYNEGELSSL